MEVQNLSSDAFTYNCGAILTALAFMGVSLCPINLSSTSREVQSVVVILACATVLQWCMSYICMSLCVVEFWTFYVPSLILDYSLCSTSALVHRRR